VPAVPSSGVMAGRRSEGPPPAPAPAPEATPTPAPAAVRPRRTRDRLLAAAVGLFADRGYNVVTLDDIGGAVGISGPAVYRHFKSKEGLLGELLVEVSERLLSSAMDRVSRATRPLETLTALVDFHVDFAVDNPAIIAVQARELTALAPGDRDRVRRLQRTYVQLWADAIVQAGLREDQEAATAAAHAIFGLLNSTPFSGRLGRDQTRSLLRSMALAALTVERVERAETAETTAAPGTLACVPDDGSRRGKDGGAMARTNPTKLVKTRQRGAVAELVLDRPDAMNALTGAMAAQIANMCRETSERLTVHAVVISSSSERAFCVGADLKERAGFNDAELATQRPVMRSAFDAVRSLEVPVIAAVAGYALGGGFELALSCDLIVADETAELGLPEASVGLVPGGGGTQLLTRRAGPAVAADLIFTARRVAAPEALRLRLVDRVVGRGTARAAALELAECVVANSPAALRAAKRAMRVGAGVDIWTGLEVEDAAWRQAAGSPDRAEGINAFVEKRRPNWPSSGGSPAGGRRRQ
jgi:enoyl-CoA hydratase/carnithine racemase/AcrR family transcriptional regulator